MTTQVDVTRIGDEFVLPLSKEVLKKLGIENGGQIEITTAEDTVVLRAAQTEDARKQEFRKLKDKIFDEYADVFTALAEGAK